MGSNKNVNPTKVQELVVGDKRMTVTMFDKLRYQYMEDRFSTLFHSAEVEINFQANYDKEHSKIVLSGDLNQALQFLKDHISDIQFKQAENSLKATPKKENTTVYSGNIMNGIRVK